MLRFQRPIEAQFVWIALAALSAGVLIWMNMHRRETPVGRRTPAIIGTLWTLFCTAEYWLFGSLSAAGRPDEYNGVIPWLQLIARGHDGGTYAHSFGGGVDAAVGMAIGTQFVSIERWLFALLPVGAAIVVMKSGAIALGYAGGYTLGRKGFGLSRGRALVVALLASVAHLYTFAWSVGGIGWAMGLLPWGLYVLSAGAAWRWYYPAVAALALLYSASASIISTLPFFLVAVVLSAPLLPPVRAARFAAGVMVFVAVSALNWADVLYASAQLSPELARTGVRQPIPSPLEVLRANSDAIAVPVVPVALLLLAVARDRFVVRAAAVFAASLLAAPALAYVAQYVPLEMARAYRWQLVVDGYVLPATAIVARALGSIRWAPPRVGPLRLPEPAAWFFAGMAVLIAADQKAINIVQLQYYGGRALFENALLPADCGWRPAPGYRVASLPSLFAPSTVSAYGVESFDGMANGFSRRRRLFFGFAVVNPPNANMHTHVHWLPVGAAATSLSGVVNVDALRVANVRYILSDRPLTDPALTVARGPCAAYPKGGGAFERWVTGWAPRAIPPAYYVHELRNPWPRAFVAATVAVSNHAIDDAAFYAEVLAHAATPAAIVSRDDAAVLTAGAKHGGQYMLSYAAVPGGFDVLISASEPAGRGLLVLNVPYSRLWRARSGVRALPTVPVNGIHLGVVIDAPAAVTVRYERQTVAGRVAGLVAGQPAHAAGPNAAAGNLRGSSWNDGDIMTTVSGAPAGAATIGANDHATFLTPENARRARSALAADGYLLIADGYDPQACREIVSFIDDYALADNTEVNYGGTELRIWDAQAKHPLLARFMEQCDRFLTDVAGEEMRAHTLLAIRNRALDPADQRSTMGRWHLD